MPFYDKPFDLKLDKRRRVNLVDDDKPIDLEYDLDIDLIDDEQPVFIINKKVPFIRMLRQSLKPWMDKIAYGQFIRKFIRPMGMGRSQDLCFACTPIVASRWCNGRMKSGSCSPYMLLAVKKDCIVIVGFREDDESPIDGPVAFTADRTLRASIERLVPIKFVRTAKNDFQFILVCH